MTTKELRFPPRISRLDELAHNLWWSWHMEGRRVFQALDYTLWRASGHNPVKQLLDITPEKLEAAAHDPVFLNAYDAAINGFDADIARCGVCLADTYPALQSEIIAYFSAEFAIHKSLPIYAGGLGVLSGDTCKEASDMGLPLIAVGFMYPQGYFLQRISAEGWQEEQYHQLTFDEAPIDPCLWANRCGPLVKMQLGDRSLYIGAWQVRVGCINLYLLDTNVEENAPQDRQLSNRLYTADREQRIQQEILLGIGGVRVLRVVGINPSIWHCNEGYTAFMTLERLREEVEKGASFEEAMRKVQATTVFTTHTPVPAGHDVFSVQLMEKYFQDFWTALGISRDAFLGLGQQPGGDDQTFNMTTLGLKIADYRNGVSKLHGQVTRKMWHVLWRDVPEEKVPVTHITNGIHSPSWVAPELYRLFEKYVGKDLLNRIDDPQAWQDVVKIPDAELWQARLTLKRKLIHIILERTQERWASGEATAEQVLAMGSLLDEDTLTIGFVRRFAEYKRPALIFYDVERLKKLIGDTKQPIQIIFAGKSHPNDFPSKYLLHQVYSLAKDRQFLGRIAFVEDYDIHLARYLVQGVDVWLNNPRRLKEASGTSGMKAAINGALHASVLDGWWAEGYNGSNGWAIGQEMGPSDPEKEDAADAASLYRLLEDRIVPLYYERDRNGIPHGWLKVVKESIQSIMPYFSTRRMLREYVEAMYLPAAKSLQKSSPT